MCVTVPNLIKIGLTVAQIRRFNGFEHGGRPPSSILNSFLTVGAVKKPILHHRAKFCRDRSNRCGDIAIFFVIFKCDRRHLGFLKFNF